MNIPLEKERLDKALLRTGFSSGTRALWQYYCLGWGGPTTRRCLAICQDVLDYAPVPLKRGIGKKINYGHTKAVALIMSNRRLNSSFKYLGAGKHTNPFRKDGSVDMELARQFISELQFDTVLRWTRAMKLIDEVKNESYHG